MSILASLAAEFVSYYKAILSRSMFSMHALVAVWRTTVIMGAIYWSLTIGVVLLVVEYFITMWVRMGEEWPWISPSTLCYLTTAAAALWVQKLESLGHIQGINGTYISTLPSTGMKMDFSASDWLLLTEQTMMVTIIVSRWLLPKGEMSHKDLSSLLLLYLALSADILDFSTIFNEPTVVRDKSFCFVILVVWTGSLAQFVLVLTNTASVDEENSRVTLKSIVCSSEIWQILVQIGLQDMPFLLIRVIALVQYQVFNFTIIFFVCKNSLVICLELYHLIATCVEQHRKLKKRKQRMAHLKSKMAAVQKVVGLGKLQNITQATKEEAGGWSEESKNQNGRIFTDSGDQNETANRNALSLFASQLSKPKVGKDGSGKWANMNEKAEITLNPDKMESSWGSQNASIQNKEVIYPGVKNKSKNDAVQNKLITQNLLFSELKKVGSKEIDASTDKQPAEKESTASEDLARTGSQLAAENNTCFDKSSTIFPQQTQRKQNIPSHHMENKRNKTQNGKTKNQTPNVQKNKMEDIEEPWLGYLHGQSTAICTPPVSHLRPFSNQREDTSGSSQSRNGEERTFGSLKWIDGKSEPRDVQTGRSLFVEDDSVF